MQPHRLTQAPCLKEFWTAYNVQLIGKWCTSSYAAFIRDNDIRQGIIVSDKGFPPKQIQKELDERPGLHFLTPIKRNDTRIVNNNMRILLAVKRRLILIRRSIRIKAKFSGPLSLNPIRICIPKQPTFAMKTAGCWNLFSTDIKAMNALIRQMSKVISH